MTNQTTQRETVIGVFSNRDDAQRAIEMLRDAGFRSDDIGILARNQDVAEDMATETGTNVGEGAATGAMTGGVLGGIGGLLVGLGALAIPGIGPVLAAGPIAATLAGAGIGAATGGLLGALVGLGIPEDEARIYEERFQRGSILVTVKAGAGRYDDAWQILRSAGAEDIDVAGSGAQYNTAAGGTNGAATQGYGQQAGYAQSGHAAATTGQESVRVPVVEETLTANKQARQAGEVEIRKNVVEEQVNIPVELRHEEVTVTRRDVNRPLQAGDRAFNEGEVISVPLHEETANVQKQARVTGEVEIQKQVVAEQQTISDTVRREVVDIDTEGDLEARNRGAGINQNQQNDYAG